VLTPQQQRGAKGLAPALVNLGGAGVLLRLSCAVAAVVPALPCVMVHA
jgi:hypothetical protein